MFNSYVSHYQAGYFNNVKSPDWTWPKWVCLTMGCPKVWCLIRYHSVPNEIAIWWGVFGSLVYHMCKHTITLLSVMPFNIIQYPHYPHKPRLIITQRFLPMSCLNFLREPPHVFPPNVHPNLHRFLHPFPGQGNLRVWLWTTIKIS